MDDLTYVRGGATLDQINRELGVRWKELPHDPAFQDLKQRHPELAQLSFDDAPPLRVEQKTAGLTPELTVVIIKILVGTGAAIAKDALIALFKTCVLPSLRKRLGRGVLKEGEGADSQTRVAYKAITGPESKVTSGDNNSEPTAVSQVVPGSESKTPPKVNTRSKAIPRSKARSKSKARAKSAPRPKTRTKSNARPKATPRPKSRPKASGRARTSK